MGERFLKLLYFSTVNWKWIKQRPHFVVHYLSKKGIEVDYLSLNPIGKVKIKRNKLNNIYIYDTYVLPFSLKFSAIEKINIALIKLLLFQKKYDVVILTSPLHYKYLPNRLKKECKIIYDCMDNMPFFYEGKNKEKLLLEESKTFEKVDGVIVSSNTLWRELESRNKRDNIDFRIIYNALEKEAFNKKPKVVQLDKPNLVYIGTISKWFDFELLDKFAKRHLNFTIYLIGPCEVRNENLSQNIRFIDSIPHEEVINYIYSGDIMILPFLVNELTKSVDPVKFYEYIAMGKPIVSSYWEELDKFKHNNHNVCFYQDYEDFENLIFDLYNNKDFSERKTDFIEYNNWESRVNEYINFINTLMKIKDK